MKLFFLSLFLITCSKTFAAGTTDLEYTTQAFIKATTTVDEKAAKYISTEDCWNRKEDSCKDLYSQMSRANQKHIFAFKLSGIASDNGAIELYKIEKLTGKIVQTLYLYAKIDGDMWVIIGWNQNNSDIVPFLKGILPSGIAPLPHTNY